MNPDDKQKNPMRIYEASLKTGKHQGDYRLVIEFDSADTKAETVEELTKAVVSLVDVMIDEDGDEPMPLDDLIDFMDNRLREYFSTHQLERGN